MIREVALKAFAAALVYLWSHCAWSSGLYGELAHASNAKATDRDLGRNFVHVGWGFDSGFMISGGLYIAGEKHCFESLTLGQKFLKGRWQATMTAHSGGICAVDSRIVPFKRNIGLCATRLLAFRERFTFGIGGCLWERPDYVISNLTNPVDPLSTKDDGTQITANLMFRFDMTRKKK